MSNAVRSVVAGAVVALLGGVLLSGVLLAKPHVQPVAAAGAPAPTETPVAPSHEVVASAAPVAVQPVDWLAVEDATIFRGGGHALGDVLLDVAVAPSGHAVIVGFDGSRDPSHRFEALAWSSASGGDWQRISLPDDIGAQPRRVIATQEGFVAIGRRASGGEDRAGPTGFIWTSRDGIDWSGVTVEGAEFDDLDSIDDTVAILGTVGNVPTVWTSRSGGPWEAATIAGASGGVRGSQLALSSVGVYLVRDRDTGLIQRSDDGILFTSVDLPERLQAGDEGREISALVRVADGFALVLGPVGGQDKDRSASMWLSSDGREWRRGGPEPGLRGARQLGFHRAAAVKNRFDSAAPPRHVSFLQADGTWCTVSHPAGMLYMGTMVWNEKGDALIAGSRVRHGAPVIWHASGVRCDPPSSDRRSPTPGAEWEKQRLPPATGPAGNGLITFSRDGDIYVGDPATGETMPIVTGPQFDTEPKFSPDGSLIAFTRYVDEGERVTDPPSNPFDYGHADPSDVHVVRPDGSDERAIEGTNSTEDLGPDGQRIFVDWTPDSQGLVVSHFWSNFRDDETARSGEGLTWFDPSGAAAPRLLTPPLPLHPVGNAGRSYAYGDGEMAGLFRPPEGDRLLSADWTGGPPLAAIDPDGSNVEVLIDRSWMVESGYDVVADASWSPDASMIAFSTSGPGGVTGSYVMDADGSDLRQLAGSGPWSPDSSRIAVVGASVPLDDGGPGHRLTIVDVATGAERELDVVTSVSGLSWSPDGRSLLVMPHRSTRLVLVDAETGIATELPWETDPWYSWQRVAVD